MHGDNVRFQKWYSMKGTTTRHSKPREVNQNEYEERPCGWYSYPQLHLIIGRRRAKGYEQQSTMSQSSTTTQDLFNIPSIICTSLSLSI